MANTDRKGDFKLDVAALEERYADERARRIREDGNDQYAKLTGQFAHFDADPNAAEGRNRAPLSDETDVLIIGGGFGGLLAGARLRQQGVRDLRIVEKGADFGGTWYWNRYPGARCDVESYIYLPMLEETGFLPSEKYADAEEIQHYCSRLAEQFDLYEGALFGTVVQSARWETEAARWIVETDRGDTIRARFMVSCTGLFSSPKLPLIPGIESFEGVSFHTSRWNYDYTGGDTHGGLTGLKGKRVGVIGTGSTGIQLVPHVAETAEQLSVFQRTPSSIDPRNNRATDPDWAQSLAPGWHRERRDNFTQLTTGGTVTRDMVADGWTDIVREVSIPTGGDAPVDPEALQSAQMHKMELSRRHIAAVVEDPATAEALKPYYHYFCKRPGFSDEYLQAYNRANVTLIDTAGKGVERITAAGVVANGTEYPLDCLIFATGFDFLTEYTREAGIEIYGRDGRALSDYWADGARTVHGMHTHGFPNFFFSGLYQAGVTINYCHIADVQTTHIAAIVGQCLRDDRRTVEATSKAEQEWIDEVIALSGPRREFLESCTPGYYNYEGKRGRSIELNEIYGGGPMRYIEILDEWIASGDMPGLSVR